MNHALGLARNAGEKEYVLMKGKLRTRGVDHILSRCKSFCEVVEAGRGLLKGHLRVVDRLPVLGAHQEPPHGHAMVLLQHVPNREEVTY